MRKTIITLLVALPLCLAAQTKSATEQRIEAQGFVNVKDADPSIQVSLMYTRPDNFTGKVLYTDLKEAYLHPLAAEALKKAQAELKRRRPELSLIVYDATRPMSVQQKMWDVVKGTSKSIYVSNPANGGGLHNYGFAVDVSICNEKGDTIPMGTIIDHLGREAQPKLEAEMLSRGVISQKALDNRRLLREVMAAGGYKVLNTEWWHFNLKTRKQVKAEGRKPIR
jgi:D-alanyl-D-alanine dipeptidase